MVELKTLTQKIMRLSAPSTDIGSAVIPSLSGTYTAGADAVQTLHLNTLAFARAYNDPKADRAAVQQHAKKVEGSLMTAVTLGAIPADAGSKLIDELQALLETRPK